MSKEYLLTFNQIIENINKFKLGTIVESEYGDKYKLTKTDKDTRKFSRIDKGLRFMTYENLDRFFKIVEEQKEIDIQSIEELDENFTYIENHISGLGIEKVLNKAEIELVNKNNELVRAVKQLDKKIKEK